MGFFFFAVFALLLLCGTLDGLESRTLDWRYRIRSPQPPGAKIALVLITDECLERLGSWPLSRSFHATAIDRLASAGARAVAFDVVFDNPSSVDPAGDKALVDSVRRYGRVVFPRVFTETRFYDESLTKATTSEESRLPFQELANVAAGMGYINADFDYLNPDGIIRQTFLVHRFQDEWAPNFPLAVAELVTGKKAVVEGQAVTLDGRPIPTIDLPPWKEAKSPWHAGAGRAVFIDYLGAMIQDPFPSCDFADLVEGTFDPAVFRDAVVFVGPSAVGLGDLHLTPFGLKPGVTAHAALAENILASNFLAAPSIPVQITLIVLLIVLASAVLLWKGSFVASTALFLTILAGYAALCFAFFAWRGTALPMTLPLLAAASHYVVTRFVQLIADLKRANVILRDQNIRLDQKVQELTALHDAGSRFPAILEMDVLAKDVIATFCRLRGADAGLLVFFEPQSGQPQPLGQMSGVRGDAFIQGSRDELAEKLSAVFSGKEALAVPGSPLFTTYFPLIVGNACWGAICLHESAGGKEPWQSPSFWPTLLGISGTALQNARLYEMARELTLAKRVQESFFPKKPLELNGYRVSGASRPATQLGGDYFDYFVVDERYLVVLIADVMGHGVAAALGMTIVKTSVLQRAKEHFAIEELAETINQTLLNTQGRKFMVTAQFTVIDTREHRASFYHRGHLFPLCRQPDGSWKEVPCTIGQPLGVKKNAPTPVTPAVILPGERWMFFTDGLFESLADTDDQTLKTQALLDYLGTRPLIAISEASADILDHHPSFLTGQPQPDDFTVLLLERDAASPAS